MRKLSAFLADALVSISLSLIALVVTLLLTILNVGYIKTTLTGSGFYNNIVPSVLKLATTQAHNNPDGGMVADSNDNPDIKTVVNELTPIAQRVLTPAFLQTNIEKVLTGFDGWLKGKSKIPQFALDFTQIKPELTNQISKYLKDKIEKLPVCGNGANLRDFDLFNAECRPAVAPNQDEYVRVTNEFIAEIPALKDNAVSFATIDKDGGFEKNNTAQKVPKIYRFTSKVPYILGGLGLLIIGVRLGISKNRARALRGLGRTFVWSGAILLFTGSVMILFLNEETSNFIGKGSAEQIEFAKTIAIPITEKLISSFGKIAVYFGTVYALIGAVCYIIAHQLKRRAGDTKEKALPTTADADAPKPDKSTGNELPVTKIDSKDSSQLIASDESNPKSINNSAILNEPTVLDQPIEKTKAN